MEERHIAAALIQVRWRQVYVNGGYAANNIQPTLEALAVDHRSSSAGIANGASADSIVIGTAEEVPREQSTLKAAAAGASVVDGAGIERWERGESGDLKQEGERNVITHGGPGTPALVSERSVEDMNPAATAVAAAALVHPTIQSRIPPEVESSPLDDSAIRKTRYAVIESGELTYPPVRIKLPAFRILLDLVRGTWSTSLCHKALYIALLYAFLLYCALFHEPSMLLERFQWHTNMMSAFSSGSVVVLLWTTGQRYSSSGDEKATRNMKENEPGGNHGADTPHVSDGRPNGKRDKWNGRRRKGKPVGYDRPRGKNRNRRPILKRYGRKYRRMCQRRGRRKSKRRDVRRCTGHRRSKAVDEREKRLTSVAGHPAAHFSERGIHTPAATGGTESVEPSGSAMANNGKDRRDVASGKAGDETARFSLDTDMRERFNGISCLLWTGVKSFVPVSSSDTIRQLKAEVWNRAGIRPCFQRVCFAGKTLEDGHTLSYYMIPNEAQVEVNMALRGGGGVGDGIAGDGQAGAGESTAPAFDNHANHHQGDLEFIKAEFLRELEGIKFIMAFAEKYSNVLLLHRAIYGEAIPELKTGEAYADALLSKIGKDTGNFNGHGRGFLKYCRRLLSTQVMPKFDALLGKLKAIETSLCFVDGVKQRAPTRNSLESEVSDSEPPSSPTSSSMRESSSRAEDTITADAKKGDFYLTRYPFSFAEMITRFGPLAYTRPAFTFHMQVVSLAVSAFCTGINLTKSHPNRGSKRMCWLCSHGIDLKKGYVFVCAM